MALNKLLFVAVPGSLNLFSSWSLCFSFIHSHTHILGPFYTVLRVTEVPQSKALLYKGAQSTKKYKGQIKYSSQKC